MKRFIFSFCVGAMMLPTSIISAQSTKGRDFIVSVDALNGTYAAEVKVVTDSATTVTFTHNFNNTSTSVNVAANSVYDYSPTTNNIVAATSASLRTLSIHATQDITVYIYDGRANNGDATIVRPIDGLDTAYYYIAKPAGNPRYSSYIVCALENNTNVYRNGTLVHSNLQAKQSISYQFGTTDGTGTRITADKPIACFAFVQEIGSGSSVGALLEHLPPITQWGTAFMIPASEAAATDEVRVLASQPGTVVYRYSANNSTYATHNIASAGQFVTFNVNAADSGCWLISNYPILVASYFSPSGRPTYYTMPPIQQAIETVLVAPYTGNSLLDHRAIIVAPTTTRNTTTMQTGTGTPTYVTSGWRTCKGNPNYSSCILTISNNSYTFHNEDGLLAIIFGWSTNASYSYVGGSAARNLVNTFYINDIPYDSLDNEVTCLGLRLEYKADIQSPLGMAAGKLKWYIDGSEVIAYRDSMSWMLPYLGIGQHTVVLEITDALNTTHVLSTTFTHQCPPVTAIPDTAMVIAGIPNFVDVLANDTLGMCGVMDVTTSISAISPPHHGTAYFDVASNRLVYTPSASFEGDDSLLYILDCVSERDSAWVYLSVYGKPANIIDPSCYGTPNAIELDIKELVRSATGVSTSSSPMIGDIDDDGETEIVVMNRNVGQTTDAILIYGFNQTTNSLYLKHSIPVTPNMHQIGSPIALAKVDGHAYASIFYASSIDRTLYKYDFDGTSWAQPSLWSPPVYTSNTTYSAVSPAIADMMGSGRTQVVILDKIIDTKTGTIIADGGFVPASGRSLTYSFGCFGAPITANIYESSMVVMDIDGDGMLEAVGGDCVYGISITNPDANSGNWFTLKQKALTSATYKDGGTAIADINNDGELEVIVVGPINDGYTVSNGVLYVYNPRTGTRIDSITSIPRSNGLTYIGLSRPAVGDLDGDGYSEIAFTGINTLYVYKYNAGTQKIDPFGTLAISDPSGAITPTIFNFAHTGNKLVCRDESHLYIIDASTGTPAIDASFLVGSSTTNEFPVVADINGDGAAEIIVTGADAAGDVGEVRVYVSNKQLWAPARSVWNQAAFYSLNVNEDLTIPKSSMSTATVFPGEDGTLGGRDERPFNTFLSQQTMLNGLGMPVFFLPSITIVDTAVIVDGDSAIITGRFTNDGQAILQAPIYLTFYRNDTIKANIIAFDTINQSLRPVDTTGHGDTLSFYIVVKNLSGFTSPAITEIWVSINDSNGVYHYQNECTRNGRAELTPDAYFVGYEPNNGGLSVRTNDDEVLKGIIYVVKEPTGIPAPLNSYFDEWNTLADGSGTRIRPGDTLILTSDTVLYAIWRATISVYDWKDLANVAKNLSGDYLLLNSLDKNSGFYETYNGGYGDDPAGGDANMGTSTTGWRPLNTFSGTFNGDNNTISDLWLNRPTDSVAGLFGIIENGKVSNLIIELGNSNEPTNPNKAGIIAPASVSAGVGALAGAVFGSDADTIKNIQVTRGEVQGTNYVGGIIGQTSGVNLADTFINRAKVTGTFQVGGVIGEMRSNICNGAVLINDNAAVSGGYYVGGVFGYYEETTGSVSLIITGLSDVNAIQVKNTGDVTATGDAAGGVFGWLLASGTTIQDYGNTVNVSGNNRVGGIVGDASIIDINITRCYNKGFITAANDEAGGIAGIIGGDVSNVYNLGYISGKNAIGGIIGTCMQLRPTDNLSYAYNAGKVASTSGDTAYGIVGNVAAAFNSVCLNFDTVTTQLSIGVPSPYDATAIGRSTYDMTFTLNDGNNGYSAQRGWSYGLNGKHTYPYFTWQLSQGLSNDLGFTSIEVEMDHPVPPIPSGGAGQLVGVNLYTSNPANNAFYVYATPLTPYYYYEPLTAGANNLDASSLNPAGKIISIGVMSESDVVTFEPDTFCKWGYPDITITGEKTVCEGNTITLTADIVNPAARMMYPTIPGIWKLSNDNAVLSNNKMTQVPSPYQDAVVVTGVHEGREFISYTTGYGMCKTTQTFLLKITASPPDVIIGFE